MRNLSVLAVALGLTASIAAPALAANLGERQALAKAVDILMGPPYGETRAEVIANITERRLGPVSATVCHGSSSRQAWSFHVVVNHPSVTGVDRIDGWLVIDGRTGKFICAALPLLD